MNPTQVQQYLGEIDYPLKKEDLVNHVKSNDAPQEVVDALEKIPDKEYRNPAEVTHQVSQIKNK